MNTIEYNSREVNTVLSIEWTHSYCVSAEPKQLSLNLSQCNEQQARKKKQILVRRSRSACLLILIAPQIFFTMHNPLCKS